MFAVFASLTLAGCAYHIYSPSTHAREIAGRETVASHLESTSADLERKNDILRGQESRLLTKLHSVQNEIQRLRNIPSTPDTTGIQKRLQLLLDEQDDLQTRLSIVRAEIAKKEEEQHKILHTGSM